MYCTDTECIFYLRNCFYFSVLKKKFWSQLNRNKNLPLRTETGLNRQKFGKALTDQTRFFSNIFWKTLNETPLQETLKNVNLLRICWIFGKRETARTLETYFSYRAAPCHERPKLRLSVLREGWRTNGYTEQGFPLNTSSGSRGMKALIWKHWIEFPFSLYVISCTFYMWFFCIVIFFGKFFAELSRFSQVAILLSQTLDNV